ncbi:F-box domain containing protein [Tanacetum coccineum]
MLIKELEPSNFRSILYELDSIHAMDNKDHSVAKLCSPYGNSKIEDVVVAGTFNGIVLLILKYHDFDKMILYNPCTGVFKIVPDPDPPLSCEVFSFKSGSWSTPSELLVRDYAIFQCGGIFLNGVLYWIAYDFDDTRLLVVALDVKEMVFLLEILSLEVYYSQSVSSRKIANGLDTLDGHLCAFIDVDEFVLWIMHEDGSEKSWSKVCMPGIDTEKFHPMCILDDRKIVMLKKPNQLIIRDMQNDSSIKVYDNKTNTLKDCRNR